MLPYRSLLYAYLGLELVHGVLLAPGLQSCIAGEILLVVVSDVGAGLDKKISEHIE